MPTDQQQTQFSEHSINLTVLSPDQTLYKGKAAGITCHNEAGDFDILPLHTNFISLVDDYVVIHQESGEKKKITIGKALLKAQENEITLLLNFDLTERDIIFKALFKQLEGKTSR